MTALADEKLAEMLTLVSEIVGISFKVTILIRLTPNALQIGSTFIDGEIKNKGKASLNNYSAVLKYLKDFEAKYKNSL